ncbi:hypothetical protein [Streptomyces sp. NPDC047097]|uniref:hypothetical protein n=1 Tax=Streptomyces sp. NPDC047097 TaxID=3155260 RepID=UPI0033E9544D
MHTPPEHLPQQPPTIDTQAAQLLAAIEDAMTSPTHHRDTTPIPPIGPTPPVPQPGRPPMSQRATDTSALMLSGSVLTLTAGGATTAILWASGHADPTALAFIAATPIGIALPILALTRLARRTKEAAQALPAEHHHHYAGPITQNHHSINTQTRSVWANTRNQIPK